MLINVSFIQNLNLIFKSTYWKWTFKFVGATIFKLFLYPYLSQCAIIIDGVDFYFCDSSSDLSSDYRLVILF